MHLRNGITYKHLFWDSWPLLLISCTWSSLVTYLFEVRGYEVIAVPTLPVATIGIVVSLYLGFKSKSAYDRWWEARQIWGQIVNDSRTFANQALNLISCPDGAEHPAPLLVHRHLAWVNALGYQLRKKSRLKVSSYQRVFDYRIKNISILPTSSPAAYERHLAEGEAEEVRHLANPATHILRLQGAHLHVLMRQGQLENNRIVAMMGVVGRLYDCQGRCERIKNTPFPRQITYFGLVFTWIFILLLPLAFVDPFAEQGAKAVGGREIDTFHVYMLAMVPFSMVVAWIFFMLEKVSESCEDPFEWATTDVPIATLTRTIEIDLLQMLGESEIPKPLEPRQGVLY